MSSISLPCHPCMSHVRTMIIEQNPGTAEHAINKACRAIDTPVSNEATPNMFSGMWNNEDICHRSNMMISTSYCMHEMTNRRTMFVRNEHASEYALHRMVVHPHRCFENAKQETVAQRIGDKHTGEKRQANDEAYETAEFRVKYKWG